MPQISYVTFNTVVRVSLATMNGFLRMSQDNYDAFRPFTRNIPKPLRAPHETSACTELAAVSYESSSSISDVVRCGHWQLPNTSEVIAQSFFEIILIAQYQQIIMADVAPIF